MVRNGPTHNGVPSFRCRECGQRFVAQPRKGPVSDDRQALIRRLLAERLSLRATARAVGVSQSWLQGFVTRMYADTPIDTNHSHGHP